MPSSAHHLGSWLLWNISSQAGHLALCSLQLSSIWRHLGLLFSVSEPLFPQISKNSFFHSWLKAPSHQAVRGNSTQHSRCQPASPGHCICFITSPIGTSRHLRSSPFSCSVCLFASLGRALTIKGVWSSLCYSLSPLTGAWEITAVQQILENK